MRVTSSQQVIPVHIADEPGSLGPLTRRIADAGINLSILNVGTGNRIILGAEDIDKLKQLVGQ